MSYTDILIISKREFQSLFNLGVNNLTEQIFKDKAGNLFKLGINIIIITMRKEGVIILNTDFSELIKPIEMAEVVDTTVAGDAFSAGFFYGFIRNTSYEFENLKHNLKIGNFVVGKCIQKLGARNGIPNIDKLILEFF
ncbi:MAG: hypothetical protein JSV23_10410 [Promethearchaeota archaeon]|nr:MAG: hypothetical protein JSV23_10410 [Candidatus Lokiarchaeota archaeon]